MGWPLNTTLHELIVLPITPLKPLSNLFQNGLPLLHVGAAAEHEVIYMP